jgi:hypothetical protein
VRSGSPGCTAASGVVPRSGAGAIRRQVVPVGPPSPHAPTASSGVGRRPAALGGAAAGAATNLWKSKVQRTQSFSWASLARDTGVGALAGAAGGVLGRAATAVAPAVRNGLAGAAARAPAAVQRARAAATQSARSAAGVRSVVSRGEATAASSEMRAAVGQAPSSLEGNASGRMVSAACFIAGTLILLADGTGKSIEDIAVGESVLAFNQETGRTESRTVSQIFVHYDVPTYELTIDGSATVTTTQYHPFWVEGRGWTSAGDLIAGEHLVQPDGSTVAISSVVPTGERETVYNFEVEGLRTYYVAVGDQWVLVHNTCDADAEGLEHVVARHTRGGAQNDAMSGTFDDGVDLGALAQGSNGQIGMRNSLTGNIEYSLRAPGSIGLTGKPSGMLPTSRYTVVRSGWDGGLITMFPGGM